MRSPIPENPSRFTAIVGAVLLLFLPASGAYWYTQSHPSAPAPTVAPKSKRSAMTLDQLTERLNTTGVLALAKEIKPNERIETKHLTEVRVSPKKLPADALRDPKKILGMYAIRKMSAGHILSGGDLSDTEITAAEEGFVPTGYSSLEIRLNQNIDRLSDWAVAGARIDVRSRQGESHVQQLSENAVILTAPRQALNDYSTGASGSVLIRIAVPSGDLSRVKAAQAKGQLRIFRRGSQMIL